MGRIPPRRPLRPETGPNYGDCLGCAVLHLFTIQVLSNRISLLRAENFDDFYTPSTQHGGIIKLQKLCSLKDRNFKEPAVFFFPRYTVSWGYVSLLAATIRLGSILG
jgi:hypothetical protein